MFTKILIFISFLFIFFGKTFALENDLCEYEEEIKKCNEAFKNWTTWSLDSFICLDNKNNFVRNYQIVLDLEFKKVDKIALTYLDDLEQDRERFLQNKEWSTPLDWINEITEFFSKSWDLYNEYNLLCWAKWKTSIWTKYSVYNSTAFCSTDLKVNNASRFKYSTDPETPSVCQEMIDDKIEMYKATAYNILLINKAQARKDQRKVYFTKQRDKFNALIDKFTVNLRYLDSIAKWWPSKTKNPKQ